MFSAKVIVFSVLLLAAVPGAPASAKGFPQISDPARDVWLGPAVGLQIAAPEVDLLTIWVSAAESRVALRITVTNLSMETVPAATRGYALVYSNDVYRAASLVATREPTGDSFTFSATRWDGTGFGKRVAGRFDLKENAVWLEADRGEVGDRLLAPVASSTLSRAGLDWSPVWFRDRAPDSGAGDDISL